MDAPDRLRNLIQLMGLEGVFLRLAGVSEDTCDPDTCPHRIAWEHALPRLEAMLEEHLADEEVAGFVDLYSSPLGRRLVRLESETFGKFKAIAEGYLRDTSESGPAND